MYTWDRVLPVPAVPAGLQIQLSEPDSVPDHISPSWSVQTIPRQDPADRQIILDSEVYQAIKDPHKKDQCKTKVYLKKNC